jgi:NADPH:quinone reductase
MKALRFEQYGPPSVLTLQELGVPDLRPGQALVELHASAVNPSDVKNVAGAFHSPLARVPGRDYAGVVAIGDGWKGKEVWGSGPGLGVTRDGTHAQYAVVDLDSLSEKPAHLSMSEAAAVGISYLAAWSALVDAAEIRAGETVLVTGAVGAVGQAAIQIAHWKGARVMGADILGSPSDADVFINAKSKDLVPEARAWTEGKGVDLALDCVGGPMFEPCLKSLRLDGRQVVLAAPPPPRGGDGRGAPSPRPFERPAPHHPRRERAARHDRRARGRPPSGTEGGSTEALRRADHPRWTPERREKALLRACPPLSKAEANVRPPSARPSRRISCGYGGRPGETAPLRCGFGTQRRAEPAPAACADVGSVTLTRIPSTRRSLGATTTSSRGLSRWRSGRRGHHRCRPPPQGRTPSWMSATRQPATRRFQPRPRRATHALRDAEARRHALSGHRALPPGESRHLARRTSTRRSCAHPVSS